MLRKKYTNFAVILGRNLSLTASRCVDVPSSKPLSEERQNELTESKKKLIWREIPSEKKGAWYSKFKLWDLEEADETGKVKESLLFSTWSQPIELRPSELRKKYELAKVKKERFMQQYLPERQEILGNDLAAAHFVIFRNGTVKFEGQHEWKKITEDGYVPLPNKYVHGLFLEAINLEGTKIYYEGLENIRRLKRLRFLSVKNMKIFDDWSLDRVSGSEFERLEVLNLSGTSVTSKGLQALYRVPSLRKLILDNPYRDAEWKLTLAMLQEITPDLQIVESQTEPVKNNVKS